LGCRVFAAFLKKSGAKNFARMGLCKPFQQALAKTKLPPFSPVALAAAAWLTKQLF